LHLAGEIRKGLPTRVVEEVIESGLLTAADIYELVLPRRTLAYRREKEQRLSPEESDRLARIVRILVRSEQALGSTEHAASWLRKPNRALAGECPIELLSSDAGARAVETVLGRVEHGVYS
jgi:putative toxin-antitoxin system antitoxin component (TIGR02293 family)